MYRPRIFITGHRGLIGNELVRLMSATCDVVGYDVKDDPDDNILDAQRIASRIKGCDGVIHLAAISRVGWGEEAPNQCRAVNVAGTKNVVDAAKNCGLKGPIVFASSREVYGNSNGATMSEDCPIEPVNVYGASKAMGEEIIRHSGLQHAIIRLSSVYGSMLDHPDRAIPALLWRSLNDLDLTITGGDRYFDFVHVKDTALGLMRAMNRMLARNESLPAVQLTTGIATTLKQLAETSIELTGSNSKVIETSGREFDPDGFVGSTDKAKEVLGWSAEIDLTTGMKVLMAQMKERGRPLDLVEMPEFKRLVA